MPRQIISSACFLCGSAAEYFEFDYGKRRQYQCRGESCGEYVITDTARRRLDVPHAGPWRKQAAALAKRLSNERQILEIWMNPKTHILETHLVDGSNADAGQATA